MAASLQRLPQAQHERVLVGEVEVGEVSSLRHQPHHTFLSGVQLQIPENQHDPLGNGIPPGVGISVHVALPSGGPVLLAFVLAADLSNRS